MDYRQAKNMQEMYIFNNERRQKLLSEALKKSSPEQQLQFVADYFLNRLEPSIIAQIDGVDESKLMHFKYDYSFLEDYGSQEVRKKEVRKWAPYCFGTSLQQVDVDIRGDEHLKIFPAVYALKMGTCIMFASELQRFAYDLGISGEIVETFDYCYDNFDGISIDNKKIKTDRLIKMQHFYNVFTIGDKKFKLDIAGLLTAEDFNNNHPDLKIDLEEFYFSEKVDNNPFINVANLNNIQDYSQLSQPRQE